jgi:hypothetical protein
MSSQDPLCAEASALADAANGFRRAAETPGSHESAPEALERAQEALQALSTAWYELAADAVPRIRGRDLRQEPDRTDSPPGGDLSNEQEVRLVGALHDVADAFASCARACRQAETTVGPVIARSRSPIA